MASSIDGNDFAILQGNVELPSNVIQTISYTGDDYTKYRVLGKRSPIFRLRSIVNVADIDAGIALMETYKATKVSGLVTLILNDHNYEDENLKVKVIDVAQEQLKNVLLWSGSLDDSDGARLVANWSLQFKEVS